jgi:hypothetical protein
MRPWPRVRVGLTAFVSRRRGSCNGWGSGILDTASTLFYEDGTPAVGVDLIVACSRCQLKIDCECGHSTGSERGCSRLAPVVCRGIRQGQFAQTGDRFPSARE